MKKKDSSFILWERFSNWNKLVRVVAFVLKISKHWLSLIKKNQNTYQTRIFLDDLVKSKYFIIKRVQQEKFTRELAMIKQNLPLPNSKILPLQPFIRNKLLHVGGRLKHSFLPEELKHSIILPKDHHVTKLTIEFIHKSNHHFARYYLVSLTREKYWIVSCKSVCREVINVCLYCKRLRVKPQLQLTSDLPEALSAVFDTPFTHTGASYFGSITIKRGKRTKRSKHMNRQKVWCRFYMLNV